MDQVQEVELTAQGGKRYDFLIIGGGIVGMTIARELIHRDSKTSICIIEKESDVAQHGSGRNSGVLHAGFYYSADSLKARFTRDGNQAMRAYCIEHSLKLNECGKLIIITSEEELEGLEELKRRGDVNGVALEWMAEDEIATIDPNARTHKKALFSPATATVDPVEICQCMKQELIDMGIEFQFKTRFKSHKDGIVTTNRSKIEVDYIINCAGLQADKIARRFGFSKDYVIMPFKGLYLKYGGDGPYVRTNIYPVPNLANPFLGVHFTVTVDGTIKIGPTATPAFWRENYRGISRFRLGEFLQVGYYMSRLFLSNSFGFRRLAISEMKKYNRRHFVNLTRGMVKEVDRKSFRKKSRPGIRAQLLHKKTLELVQDFVIEGDQHSMHVLNAVSPAFTCSMPFAAHVVDEIELKRNDI